jgi:hypothetical protein
MKLADEAQSLLLYQFKEAKKLKGLIASLVSPLHTIANGIDHFREGLHIHEISGQWLDILGGIVGQPRSGMSDEEYRKWLKIRIKLNRCHGTPEEVINIVRLLCGNGYPLKITEYLLNDVVFGFFAPFNTPPAAVFSLIKKASPPGFKQHFVDATQEKPFQLDKVPFSKSQFADFFQEDFIHERIKMGHQPQS